MKYIHYTYISYFIKNANIHNLDLQNYFDFCFILFKLLNLINTIIIKKR